MIDKQPEALWMADCLDLDAQPVAWYREAAAELRRLHEVNAELVEALTMMLDCYNSQGKLFPEQEEVGYTAIAKATGEQQ